jgi:hypothetical protein
MRYLLLVLAMGIYTPSAMAQGGPSAEREFIMSCTYGVLAGTLVGAASLAFTDQPGENLKMVARGASIGLYIGIGLGVYTAYILPGQLEKEENRILEGETPDDSASLPRWLVFPLVADNRVDGVGAVMTAYTF